MKEHLFKKFERSIRWNSLESLSYQTLFCLHQIALYNSCSPKLYGSVGVFFSIVFLTVGLSNFGLSATIAPFIKYATRSREHFTNVLGQHALVQLCLIVGASIVAGICSSYVVPPNTIDPFFVSLLTALLTLLEGLKHIARTLLQSAFYNKITALIQVASISSYVIIIWGYTYITTTSFAFTSIVVPWIGISLISTALLFFFCIRWYQSLPTTVHDKNTFKDLQQRSQSARWSNALLGLIGQLFSRNAMVTLCTIQCGVESVASIKIITYILYSVLSIFRNIFQKPSAALLGWSKGSKANEFTVFTYIVNTITYHPLSYVLLFFGAFYYVGYISLHNQYSFSLSTTLILCLLCVVENVQIMYESFFLNKERTDLLIGLYGSSLLLCGALFLLVGSIDHITFLTIILSARLVSCAIAALLSAYLWKFVPFGLGIEKEILKNPKKEL